MSSTKAKKQSYQLLRGMKDILPEEERYWRFLSERVVDFARRFGYSRIETPVLEQASLYLRSSGPSSDVVTKEMYVFTDPGNERVALRPEGTPGVVRAYIEHGLLNQPQPVKFFYMGPMFRHDRPQAGRFRQHTQFGFEVIGDQSPILDAQLIMMGYRFYKDINLAIQIDVNSIGCSVCRPRYVKKLTQFLTDNKKSLGLDDQERLKKNPLRVLDSKDPNLEPVLQQAPQSVDFLCDECKDHFVLVLEYLDELDVTYNLNPRIVRGLDYYSKTTWEIIETARTGGQDSLGGGGRYDELLHTLGARAKTPAVGFACGVERTITRLRANDIAVPTLPKAGLYIAQLGKEAKKKALRLFTLLDSEGYHVAENLSKDGLKTQLESADRLGVKYALIIGQQEIVDNTVLIRDMENGNQETVDWAKIVPEIGKRLEKGVNSKRLERQQPPLLPVQPQ
ncbi:MAG: histidine--tRNA ligase [Candidatus Komeilibacteria bacterium RIFCSPLOWO2_01_FULL_52_15]|uniref:Histidine--tRNA ligase n=1 Tax=Candidatus Komeilibacteria bacterium RIFCSPLOWO2_01_FULL_52_15 TaxID=1798551 RepID=A0A1G2BP41_9BACT|nr:MAG: histidine--tRNA ligase [Candidatus Komeilibacteria bacterium RIFCSPLOWO2_01_FULL_52_15]